ncbi:MAG: hypothetical protein KJ709_09695 [Nanoarchaeota archaeon]|nr:hypothetical protein [Nanoarchaeota archaeon]
MSSKLAQHDPAVLKKWPTSKLGKLYTNSFTHSRKDPGELSQFETVAKILFDRPFDERKDIYRHIQNELAASIWAEDYEKAAFLRDMKEHFHRYIF